MRAFKRGLAVLLTVLLMMPNVPVFASTGVDTGVVEEVTTLAETIDETVNDITNENVDNTTNESVEETTEEVVEETTEEAVEETTEEAVEETTEEAVEETTEEAVEETTEEAVEETTEEAVEETTEEAVEETMEETVEETTEEVVEETTEVLEEETVEEEKFLGEAELTFEEVIYYNTGNYNAKVTDIVLFEAGESDNYFEEDGSCTIFLTEANPFFPYEVQFTYDGVVTNEWFMTPDDTVEIGGHTFSIAAEFDNTAVTQMTLNVAGKKVIVYPQAKEFTNDGGVSTYSLLPLEEKHLQADLTGLTPIELTMVSFDSIFTGTEALTNTDRVAWTYSSSNDDYTVSTSGDKVDLSIHTEYGYGDWEMIVGAADQLSASDIRYNIDVDYTESENWLIPTVYIQDDAGARTKVTVTNSNYYDYRKEERRQYIYVSSEELGSNREAYVSLKVNADVFANPNYSSMKVFEGKYNTAAEAAGATDITSKILANDMTQSNAGYLMKRYNDKGITMVIYDASGNAIGCLPFELCLYTSGSSSEEVENSMSIYGPYLLDEDGNKDNITDRSSTNTKDGIKYRTSTLYKEFPVNGQYGIYLEYAAAGYENNEAVTAVYVGNYSSIAEANAAGAVNIREQVLGYSSTCYIADYSQGVYFTIFVGEDGDSKQEVYRYNVKTEAGTDVKYKLDSYAYVTFNDFKNAEGTIVSAYQIDSQEDSYAEFNYLTVLVEDDVDLSNLAPVYTTRDSVKLYAAGSSSPVVSGETYFNFANGPVQFTTSAENGVNSTNYWVQVIKTEDIANNYYINSLKDDRAETKVENGVVYSNREILLDAHHQDRHDIVIANMGTAAISNLSVELSSDVLELDGYWTLTGNYALEGLSDIYDPENLAKIRLKAKTTDATEVTGTLTIKSGSTTLAVLNLTGIIGAPSIVTKEIPQAVKYVPYGTMIQNNNSYRWNTPTYTLVDGALPDGMIIKPNGEIYGVPKEFGEFTFTVQMDNSDSELEDDEKTFTMTVVDNTDENVENATDTGYTLTERVENVNDSSSGSQLLVSEGEFVTFVDIYLDGVKLVKGVDYEAESGSTRITIQNQTLKNTLNGTHTLGIEFREEDTLKRAAQNYENTSTSYVPDSGEDNTGSTGSSSSTASSSNSGSSSSTVASTNAASTGVSGVIEWTNVENLLASGKAQSVVDTASNITNINIPVNGSLLISPSVLQSIQGKATTVAFHTGNGIALSISGRNLTGLNLAAFKTLDLTVNSNTKNIPASLVATVATTSLKEMQFSVKDTGTYPALINMHLAVGKEYAGKIANLYRHNPETGRLEYGGSFAITADGQAMFALRRGGNFLVTVTASPAGANVPVAAAAGQYTVQLGDSMYIIARRNGMSLNELLSKNPQISAPYMIKPGQVINL